MTPKKLLLLSLSAGSGHVRAAEAIRKTAAELYPSLDVVHKDMAEFMSTPVKTAIITSYDILVKQLPELWGYLYKKTDDPSRVKRFQKISAFTNRMDAHDLYTFVSSFVPDRILCTHFLPAQSLISASKKYAFPAPSLLMTDYDKHVFLTHPGIKEYFVATKKMKFKLMDSGIPEGKLHITGIPVDPVFYAKKEITTLRKTYGIDGKNPVLLVMAGGQGFVNIHDLITSLFSLTTPVTIIAIAGNNPSLRKKVERLTPPRHISVQAVGWTDAVDEYMRIADMIITKPGGMTTTECIALGKPILAMHPIPGQEEQNAQYILEHDLGYVARDRFDLLYYTNLILSEKRKQNAVPGIPAAQRILKHLLSSSSAPDRD
ncbi:MAG TPA: glycosyltransferase [Candidatus Kapabacteria bacterium]|nr:glycosyltransferase [Candidatus Kapabacteria bacterium]